MKGSFAKYNYIHVYHISNGFLYLIDNIRYKDICYFVSKADVSAIKELWTCELFSQLAFAVCCK